MNSDKQKHTDRAFEAELANLRENLLMMAGRVETMIEQSVRALRDGDSELARETIGSDHLVNRAEVETDELCLLIFAKRQPVASDLRFVTLALKMVTDLERIGDLAVNICERAGDIASNGGSVGNDKIFRMAEIARGMVRDAIDAFVSRNVNEAQSVIDSDDEIDDLFTEVFREVLDNMVSDETQVEYGIQLQAVAKFLERIGDHATNIAEQVVFMIKGKDIRHIGHL